MATNIKTLKDKDGIVAPRTTVSAVYLEDLTTTIEDALDSKAPLNSPNFTGTVTGVLKSWTVELTTTWTGSEAPYSQEVTVTGLLATDKVDVDVQQTGTYATDQSIVSQWSNVYRVVPTDNTLTFYATVATTSAFDINVKVVR